MERGETNEVQEREGTPNNTEEPPVLPPDSPPLKTAAAADAGSEATTAEASASEDRAKVPPTVPGLTEMLNEWQIAGTPEEKQFFSVQVVQCVCLCVGTL